MKRTLSLSLIAAFVALSPACKEVSKEEEKECEERCVSTLAGSGKVEATDAKAEDAGFNLPKGIAVAPDGGVYVADTANHSIRLIKDGAVTTVAGAGEAGFADGEGSAAKFSSPAGLAVGADGTIYVADQGNHRVRAIRGGQVSTLAGSGEQGFADGPAGSAKFFAPTGVAVDAAGTVYVADFGNHRVRAVRAGNVETFVANGDEGSELGTRAATRLRNPHDVALDAAGTLFIADTANQRVLRVDGDRVVLVAGNPAKDDKTATAEKAILLGAPAGITVGPDGVYVADWFRHRVFRLHDGKVVAVAGAAGNADDSAPDTGEGQSGFKDGLPAKSKFASPFALAFDASGALLIADAKNHRIRKLSPN